jgi:hypothetical protein
MYTNRYIIIYTHWTRQLNIGSFVGVFVQHRPMTTTTIRQGEDSCMNLWIVTFLNEMSCMSSCAIHIAYARAMMSRHCALFMLL